MEPPPSSQMKPPPSVKFKMEAPSSPMRSPSPMERPSQMPPASSQSHFDTFTNFIPNPSAPFDDEFARLASSQNWVPGSQSYVQERTIAMRTELKLHYFSQSQSQSQSQPQEQRQDQAHEQEPKRKLPQERHPNAELHPNAPPTPEQLLQGFQDLCAEVGIPPSATVWECKRELKKKLVNIIDLIDARRTLKEVEVWEDFEAFRDYTLQDEHRISVKEAREDGGILAALLQRLRGRRTQAGKVVSGRVGKRRRGPR